MNILTQEQRDKSLALLAKAPDEILLSAVVDLRKHWHHMQATRANYDLVMTELAGAEGAAKDLQAMPTTPEEATTQRAKRRRFN